MDKDKPIDFRVHDEGYISYGNRVREIKHTQGTTPEEFVRIYNKLTKDGGLNITEDYFQRLYKEVYKEDFILNGKQKRPFPYINTVIKSILDIDYLQRKSIDIGPIIKEFNESNNSDELSHVAHLAGLSAIYTSAGYRINFPLKKKTSKNPDLLVDGINADLKVIGPVDVDKLHKERGPVFTMGIGEALCYDIGKAIENRLCIGIEQSDLVFIDLASKSLTYMFVGNVMTNYPDKYSLILPEPIKHRVIFCCTTSLPSNLNRRMKGELPYSFFGTYIDIDPSLWEVVKSNKTTIEFKKGEGRFIHFKQ